MHCTVEVVNAEEWDEIDTQLTQPHHFGTLRRVVIQSDRQREEVRRNVLVKHVPGLVEKGVLVC